MGRRALPDARRRPRHRGIAGKSSGGYGAMVTPMLRPDLFGGLRHARRRRALRDVLPARVPQVRARAARPLRRLVRAVLGGLPLAARVRARTTDARAPQRLVHGGVLLGRRGRHGAAARSTPRPASCGRRSGSAGSPGTRCGWRREHADALRSLRAIYIDAGKRDEFFLDLGAEAFRRELEAVGVTDVLLRALRRDARGDRVPLSARGEVPGRTPVVIATPAVAPLVCLDPGHGTPPAIGRQLEPIGPGSQGTEDQGRRRRGGRGAGRAGDRDASARRLLLARGFRVAMTRTGPTISSATATATSRGRGFATGGTRR